MKSLIQIALLLAVASPAHALSSKEQYRIKQHAVWMDLLQKQSDCQYKFIDHKDITIYADCLYSVANESEQLVESLETSPYKAAINAQMGTIEQWKKTRERVCTESAIKDDGAFVAQYNSACLARQNLDRAAGALNVLRK